MNRSNDKSRRQMWQRLIACVLILTFFSAGCEPLRKKFIRQKKKAEDGTQFVPVFEPEEYPAAVQTAYNQYDQLYVMWMVWQKEFLKDLDGQGSPKRIKSSLAKMQENMQAMGNLLEEGSAKQLLEHYILSLEKIFQQLEEPSALRNDFAIRREIVRLEKDMRAHLKAAQVKDQLLK